MSSGPFYADKPERAAGRLGVDPTSGLTAAEAAERLIRHGPNVLQRVGARSWQSVLLAQFVDLLILILIAAALVSLAIGHPGDALTILAVVVLNGILGFVQEWRAEQSLEALQSMLAQKSRVIRDGSEQLIDAAELVPGDIVLLKIGDRVPADIRLTEVVNLRIDESALTGESVPVPKFTDAQSVDTALASRACMAWMGSPVVNGYGRGLVVATAMETEFGRIAELTQLVGKERTPLQKRLDTLGKNLGLLSVVLSFAVALLGWLLGRPLAEMFFTGVALAVAIVPEALPIVVTTTLALGIRAMVRKQALFRRLQAAETLGSTTVICSDKTGTITSNEMTVTNIWLPAGEVTVTGEGYEPKGHFEVAGERIDSAQRQDLIALLTTALVCNRAGLTERQGVWEHSGQPTEAALVTAAYKALLAPPELRQATELSFNSERKRMTVVLNDANGSGFIAHAKGAPEVILERCTEVRVGDETVALDSVRRAEIEAAYLSMAERGLRVLAVATRQLPANASLGEEDVEQQFVFLGFAGIMDPPRPEVAGAIELARQAGMRVVIITGDAAATALAVAKRIGLELKSALTGEELTRLSDAELMQSLHGDVLFARTAPRHKLRIVGLLQDQGEVVAMTGDGVNDAPALKKADIGVAMGIRGTDVARSAADLILLDDNFSSIVAAVDEGRRQYDNIRKFVRYILSAHFGEVIAIFVNIVIGGPLILLPVQILWMNLVTDGITAIALGLEPGEADRMQRPPRDAEASLPNRRSLLMILIVGTYIGLATVALFYFSLGQGTEADVLRAQTIAFTGLIVLEKFNLFNCRSLNQPLSRVGWFSNPWLLGAVAIAMSAQLCAVYLPFMQRALHTVALTLEDWGLMLLVALPLLVAGEVWKWLRMRRAS